MSIYLSPVPSGLSGVLAPTPFARVWRIVGEALEFRPDFFRATGIAQRLGMAVRFAALMGSQGNADGPGAQTEGVSMFFPFS